MKRTVMNIFSLFLLIAVLSVPFEVSAIKIDGRKKGDEWKQNSTLYELKEIRSDSGNDASDASCIVVEEGSKIYILCVASYKTAAEDNTNKGVRIAIGNDVFEADASGNSYPSFDTDKYSFEYASDVDDTGGLSVECCIDFKTQLPEKVGFDVSVIDAADVASRVCHCSYTVKSRTTTVNSGNAIVTPSGTERISTTTEKTTREKTTKEKTTKEKTTKATTSKTSSTRSTTAGLKRSSTTWTTQNITGFTSSAKQKVTQKSTVKVSKTENATKFKSSKVPSVTDNSVTEVIEIPATAKSVSSETTPSVSVTVIIPEDESASDNNSHTIKMLAVIIVALIVAFMAFYGTMSLSGKHKNDDDKGENK